MQILYLTLSILLASGFYYLGNRISHFLKLDLITNKISKPEYQYALIGIASLILIFYPIFFLGLFNKVLFLTISYLLIFFGLINFYKNFRMLIYFFKNNLNKIKSIDFYSFLILLLIILYFLLSISPITSGDSVSYHMGAAKYIFEHGNISPDLFYSEAPLVAAGEFLNAFAFSIKAYQFTSLINFIGIVSIFGIIKKFGTDNFLPRRCQNFLFLCILSCPVLVFLISSSKSQLFSTSLIFFSYALLIYCINYTVKKNFLLKASYFLISLPIVAIQTKISFSVSFFIIILTFFLFFLKKIEIKNFILILTVLCVIGLLPQILWKQNFYDYPFYNFLINPFPINIPGYYEVYLNVKNYYQEKFPLILFMPLDFSDLTQFIGVGMLSIFFLFKLNYQNKKTILSIIIFFFIVYSFSGQKAARFYLEIYFFIILSLTFVIKGIHHKYAFKFLNFSIVLQSIFILFLTSYGVFNLLPGSFSDQLNKKVLSKYASGYNLYSWANSVLPNDSVTLIKHRSFYFAEKKMVYFGMSVFLNDLNKDEKKYYLKKIEQKKPNYILFYGNEESFNYDGFNFKECTSGLFRKKINVGYYETRNPFNTDKNYYNAYIYNFDSTKLGNCVKFN